MQMLIPDSNIYRIPIRANLGLRQISAFCLLCGRLKGFVSDLEAIKRTRFEQNKKRLGKKSPTRLDELILGVVDIYVFPWSNAASIQNKSAMDFSTEMPPTPLWNNSKNHLIWWPGASLGNLKLAQPRRQLLIKLQNKSLKFLGFQLNFTIPTRHSYLLRVGAPTSNKKM